MTAWEVHAIKYADRNARTRADSLIFDDNHDAPHAIDYFMWHFGRGHNPLVREYFPSGIAPHITRRDKGRQ